MDHELETGQRFEVLLRAAAKLKRLARRALRLLGLQPAEEPYWESRKHFRYVLYVQELVRILERDAKSAIDVGARDTPIIEDFDWIEDRSTLDYSNSYSSERVKGISVDFFKFDPPQHYDLALCLQVLEHIHDAVGFAQKLFQIADRVMITVPYKWRAGANKWHVQDPVDFNKLHSWTGREPLISAIIQERMGPRRILAYYRQTDLTKEESDRIGSLKLPGMRMQVRPPMMAEQKL
jgi:hypothetical protein